MVTKVTRSPTKSTAANSSQPEEPKEDDRPPWLVFAIFLIAAIAVLALLAWSFRSASLLFIELLLAAGAASVGVLLGFLFGMPRGPADINATSSSGENAAADLTYRPSNNLEQISDWLTKILIGVGLVELGEMRAMLSDIGHAVAASVIGAPAATNAVSQVVVVTFLVLGFLVSFLWTRIYYGPLQTRVDKGVIDSLRGQLRQEKKEKEKAVAVVRDMATGEKPVANISPAKDKKTTRSVKPIEGQWSTKVMQKMEEFMNSPRTWNSDPGAQLFRGAPHEENGRRLEAEMVLDLDDALMIDLRVIRITGENLTGTVAFLLHPTFSDPILYAEPKDGLAERRISASGWFTVVAIADGGDTVLSLDLRDLPNAPDWFKKR